MKVDFRPGENLNYNQKASSEKMRLFILKSIDKNIFYMI